MRTALAHSPARSPGGTVDLTTYEEEDAFLEGTGSLVLDRINKTAYIALR